MSYAVAPKRQRFRIAAENEAKLDLARDLLARHRSSRALLFGEFVDQVEALARHLGAPAITGKTAKPERERLFEAFRRGEERRLVLSRVGNFAVDLPDADLLVQLSGTFGSRQEEAQRLGRAVLHPGLPPHLRGGVRAQAPAVPDRACICHACAILDSPCLGRCSLTGLDLILMMIFQAACNATALSTP
jgi:hypothetical protein